MVTPLGLTGLETDAVVETLLQKELESGVQTIQYQINTLMTTNGRLLPLQNLVNLAYRV